MDDLQSLINIPRIWKSLSRVEERLLEAATAEDNYLTKIAQHLLVAGGKRFRPLLALLAAEFGPHNDRRPVEAGVSVELIHVGSLYHDDVIDEADTRRGAPSVNANWSNTIAILAGDFLMARASEVAATHLSQESVRLLAATYAELVEGQTKELQLLGNLDHSIDEYHEVIGGKTASLIRTSARLGALAADAPADVVEALSSWGWEVGMVFQIADDALDLVADEETIGKPAGSDIREGTFTAPVLLAASGPSGDRIRHLLGGPMPYPEPVVEEVIDLVRAGDHVEEALQEATRRLDLASKALAALPDGKPRKILETLGSYLVERVDAAKT
jgi:heptaprenyl diphosphate synthase